MFRLKLIQTLVLFNVVLFVRSTSLDLETEPIYEVQVDNNSVEVSRLKREALPTRRGHLLGLLANKYNTNYYRPAPAPAPIYEEHHHTSGGGNTATFAQSSAGTISTNGGHGGNIGSQSSSQSASYSFGPFSASFSASQSNANGGGFFDY